MIFCRETFDKEVCSVERWLTVKNKGLYADLFDGEESDSEIR